MLNKKLKSERKKMMIKKELLKEITDFKQDNIHGAVYLTLKALQLIKKAVNEETEKSIEKLAGLIQDLEQSHPEIAAIKNNLEEVLIEVKDKERKETIKKIVDKRIRKVMEKENQTITNLGLELTKYQSIMTISASSTVKEACLKIAKDGKKRSAYILESRPRFEGRILAEELGKKGWEVKLIIDAAMGYYEKEVEAFIIGADMIFGDGGVINKVGSYPMALVAKEAEKPFIVAASSNKDVTLKSKIYRTIIKEREEKELLEIKLKNVKPKNIYFDFIPKKLITKRIKA
jgi:translation initiation factor 2B subunit (eIF-2B alpha/beta/delta family)